jgi:hypothetical protein
MNPKCCNNDILLEQQEQLWIRGWKYLWIFIYILETNCIHCRKDIMYYYFMHNEVDNQVDITCLHNETEDVISNFDKIYTRYGSANKRIFKINIPVILSRLPEYARTQELELYLKLL